MGLGVKRVRKRERQGSGSPPCGPTWTLNSPAAAGRRAPPVPGTGALTREPGRAAPCAGCPEPPPASRSRIPSCRHFPFPPSQLLAQRTPLTALSSSSPQDGPHACPYLPEQSMCFLSFFRPKIEGALQPLHFLGWVGKPEVLGGVSPPWSSRSLSKAQGKWAPGSQCPVAGASALSACPPGARATLCLPPSLSSVETKAQCEGSPASTFPPTAPPATPPAKVLSHAPHLLGAGGRERKWPWQPPGVGGALV